jgi:Domain of unknown function (DUF6438)
MSTDAPPQESLFVPGVSAVVVASVLTVAALFCGIVWLYESKLAPSRREAIWLDSQRNAPEAVGAPLEDDTVITLARTRCFGSCPAYNISIHGSGRVEFNGQAFVCEMAPAPVQIDRSSVRQLVNGLVAVDFDGIPSYIQEDATDGYTATVTLSRRNHVHAVRHYHGSASAPRLLSWIENRIDEISGSSAWTGTLVQGVRICTPKDGTTRQITETHLDVPPADP